MKLSDCYDYLDDLFFDEILSECIRERIKRIETAIETYDTTESVNEEYVVIHAIVNSDCITLTYSVPVFQKSLCIHILEDGFSFDKYKIADLDDDVSIDKFLGMYADMVSGIIS
jgi:hypothetical protein